MASLFTRPGSKFIWVKYRDPASGKIVRESTKIDASMPDAKREAKKLKARYDIKEAKSATIRDKERWRAWAPAYIAERYAGKGSLKAAMQALEDLLMYFDEKEILAPRQVTHDVAAEFLNWRLNQRMPRKKRTKKSGVEKEQKSGIGKISRNTTALRFVYFTILMSEAVRRGFAESNTCREVDVKRDAAKEKREITPKDQIKIEAALANGPEWMRDQWAILMHQGCRIAETNIPIERVDARSMLITLKIKGGKLHTATLHPALLPIVSRATAEGRKTLLGVENVGSWSPLWSLFFKRLNMPYSAHCTRVTVITRLVRAGHPVVEICNFIGHTEEVNRIYRKLKPQDSSSLLATLAGGANPSSNSRRRRIQGVRQAMPRRALSWFGRAKGA